MPAAETARQAIHLAAGLLAFAVRFLGAVGSVLLAAAALVFNALVLPRIGGRRLWRDAERQRGFALGIVAFPASVLALTLLWAARLEVAAAVWGILAFGDGLATLVGRAAGSRPLPWNRDKSWAGSLAMWLGGWVAASVLILWTAPGRYGIGFAVGVAALAALGAALLESLPGRLDDNLRVPLPTALLLTGLLESGGRWLPLATSAFGTRLLTGAAINVGLALVMVRVAAARPAGAAAGALVGTVIYAFLGAPGLGLLIAFVVIGSVCTRLGYRRKAAAGIAEPHGGRRGAGSALANLGVAAACAAFAQLTPHGELFTLAFAAALAAAATDTAASEIGQAWGRRTLLISTLRPVPAGTDGGVSIPGTAAGALAGAVVALLGVRLGLYGLDRAALVAASALAANLLESLVGATVERRGGLDNHEVNVLNTLLGALIAIALSVRF